MDLKKVLKLCFLVAIEAIFCFTPLGSIPIGPIVATLAMLPVIVTALIFGYKEGMFLGFVMATFCFIYWTFIMPAYPTAFLFTPFSEAAGYKGNFCSLIICFVPRILTGLVPALVLKMNDVKKAKNDFGKEIFNFRSAIASILGSLTNTFLVLIFFFIFFGREYETILENSLIVILGTTILTNGIPEAIIAGIVCPVIAKAIKNI